MLIVALLNSCFLSFYVYSVSCSVFMLRDNVGLVLRHEQAWSMQPLSIVLWHDIHYVLYTCLVSIAFDTIPVFTIFTCL